MSPLRPARLVLTENGVPYSPEYDDIYHSDGGALAQAQQVFIAGNGLPARWKKRASFVIVETGFGLGHNFLATWRAWREDADRCERLHFVSVEKHPMAARDMATAHAASAAPTDLSAVLLARWPMLVPGTHRLEFDGGRVVLTLLFGDAAECLAICEARADAIYLDGFSPRHNQDMWSPAVFAQLARMAAPGCTLATWSVSGGVRTELTAAGFETHKTAGFASKRDMLVGSHAGTATDPVATQSKDVIVVGAGLAGTGIAQRLSARGWQMTLLEAAVAPAQGASGNLAGAFRPLPSIDDNRMARLTRAGFLDGLQHLAALTEAGHVVKWAACGALHLARDAKQANKQMDTVRALAAPDEFLQYTDAARASELCGQTTAAGGWWFPRAGWISPPSLCAANLAAAGDTVSAHFGVQVARLSYEKDCWIAWTVDGRELARASHVVLANAHDARRLAQVDWLPLRAARGQVTHLAASACQAPTTVVCGSGYVAPAVDGLVALGATFMADDHSLDMREAEHADNIAKLARMLPDLARQAPAAIAGGRVGLRPVSPDRLPMVGKLADGLWLLSGFGARGLVWGNLCAELLASLMNGDPLPIERDLTDALDPKRYRT